jgi:hypothetical protein
MDFPIKLDCLFNQINNLFRIYLITFKYVYYMYIETSLSPSYN